MKIKHPLLIATFVFSLGLTACSNSEPASTTVEERVVPVQVEKVALGTIDERASIVGKLSPDEKVDVSPKVAGKIQAIHVELGQSVKQGAALFTLDKTDLANAVKQAKAAYDLALANLHQTETSASQGVDQAQTTVAQLQNSISEAQNGVAQQEQMLRDAELNEQRTRQLHQAGAVSDAELERAVTALKNAQIGLENARTGLSNAQTSFANAQKNLEHAKSKSAVKVGKASVDQARVALENAQTQLANAQVTAPISGTISLVHSSTGQMVSPQLPVISIAHLDPLKVKANLSEQEVTTVKVGNTVSVEIPAIKKTINAKITAVSPVMNEEVKGYPIEITIPNPNGELKADMVAQVRFESQSGQKYTLISHKALIEEQGKQYVYKLDGDHVVKTEIVTGKETSEKLEIKKGLSVGDQVVVKGQTLLTDGAKVKIQEQNKK